MDLRRFSRGARRLVLDATGRKFPVAPGAWPSQLDANAVNGEYRYDQDTTAGDTFTWVPQVTESGDYRVSVHYAPDAAASPAAPY